MKHQQHPAAAAIVSFALIALCAAAVGSDIDFPSGTWEHPNGTSTNGWDSSQRTGITVMPDGTSASVTVTFVGTATPESRNLQDINESYFEGFAFQQDPDQVENTASMENYMRIDIAFSAEVEIERFILNDVDVNEVVQAEGWTDAPDSPGAGIPAAYSFGDKLKQENYFGIEGVTPKNPSGTTLDPEANVGIAFNEPIKSLSVYYWSSGPANFSVITIGVEGDILINTIDPSPQLYFTFDFSNEGNNAKPTSFFSALPAGLTWDPDYVVKSGKITGTPLSFQKGNTEVSGKNLVLHPGTNSLTLRTMETSASGTITTEATLDPKNPHQDVIIRSATIELP